MPGSRAVLFWCKAEKTDFPCSDSIKFSYWAAPKLFSKRMEAMGRHPI